MRSMKRERKEKGDSRCSCLELADFCSSSPFGREMLIADIRDAGFSLAWSVGRKAFKRIERRNENGQTIVEYFVRNSVTKKEK